MGPLGSQESRMNFTGENTYRRKEAGEGCHSLLGSPSAPASGAGSFLSIATTVLGSESTHCMYFPPL